MNVTSSPSTALADADQKANDDLPATAVVANLPIHRDERPLAGVVAALNDYERLEVERLRRTAQEELVARQRFD